jgi:hypothetical protein
MSLIDELDVLVDDRSTEFEAFEPALYVNQYCFNGVFGERHNANYFYNKGSLTGYAILRQIIHVISCYDMINVEIHGICSDAGGGNARLFMLLTQGSKVAFGICNAVSFVWKGRKIWIFVCSTHNLKAARNSLFRSQMGGTRNCMLGDVPFG